MKVVGRNRLEEFMQRHADVRSQVEAWLCEAEESDWKIPQDIKERYQQASFLSHNRVIFNLKGNDYRLQVKVSYSSKIILIEKIGTHAEYSKWDF